MKFSILIAFVVFVTQGFSQVNSNGTATVTYPVVFIDNVKSDVKEMHKLNPSDIIIVTTLNGPEAIKKIGPEGKDGVMYVQTKSFVRNNNWKFLSSKSPEFAAAVTSAANSGDVQYIVNGRMVTKNIEKTISGINDKNFRSLLVMSHDELYKEYKVKDKKYGIVILADPRRFAQD